MRHDLSKALVLAEIIPSRVDLQIPGQRTAWNFADAFENGQSLFKLAEKAVGLSEYDFVVRSGTSLMMQLLEAGGIEPVTDTLRQADIDNPHGHYEWEPIKGIRDNPKLLDDPALEDKASNASQCFFRPCRRDINTK